MKCQTCLRILQRAQAYIHINFINIVQANEMSNWFEHFTMSEAYIHINFINIVQASEMPNKFEHFATNAAYVHKTFLKQKQVH